MRHFKTPTKPKRTALRPETTTFHGPDYFYGPGDYSYPSPFAASSPVPLDISPSWFTGPREFPAALRGPIKHVPVKTSFASLLQFQMDFFADPDTEMDLQPFVGDLPLKWEVDSLDIANATFLFYDEHGSFVPANVLLYRRAETALRFSKTAPDTLLLVRLRGENVARPALWSELIDPALPTFRYIDSCMVNTDRYLRPLLEYAIGGGCEVVTVCGGNCGPELRVFRSGVTGYQKANLLDICGSTPLLTLRAISRADDDISETLGRFLDREEVSVSLPNVMHDGKLVGSGKYTPIEYGRSVREILTALIGIGLLERCDKDGSVILTASGARLLDVLPPRMFDPDARLRWMDPATDLILPEHAEASERWLRNFYGEMRKVALRHCDRARSSHNIELELLDMLIQHDS
ncbi:hypothetical protein OIU34_19750 [Pararhizobium sp. BT-229]|uniref:hypothetical protein n=1 Tax=Pararhizobium sp. BT-229 TaxID=2986923 RepID=UPI0021F70192|nr:hypothetical protein [Pararhizobium sp. BT-229]MCV9964120.1 hypothetical protein [Pararhizobium sp. BT-229]